MLVKIVMRNKKLLMTRNCKRKMKWRACMLASVLMIDVIVIDDFEDFKRKMKLRACMPATVFMIVVIDDVEDFKRKISLRGCMPAA